MVVDTCAISLKTEKCKAAEERVTELTEQVTKCERETKVWIIL